MFPKGENTMKKNKFIFLLPLLLASIVACGNVSSVTPSTGNTPSTVNPTTTMPGTTTTPTTTPDSIVHQKLIVVKHMLMNHI